MIQLSRYEQETIVNYNNGDKTCTVYTADPIVMRKLDSLVDRFPNHYKLIAQDEVSKTYEFSKKLVSFRTPPRELTEEEKERNRQNLAKYAFQKKQAEEANKE